MSAAAGNATDAPGSAAAPPPAANGSSDASPEPGVDAARSVPRALARSAQQPPGPDRPAEPAAPRLALRDGPASLVGSPEQLADAVRRLAAGHGPVAVDAERASGYRYFQRAYLIQFRRAGSGTLLIDPTRCGDLRDLAHPLAQPEWVLHAATQDLPCLAELGLRPARLFDTELSGRLLGMPRVSLAALVESVLGFTMVKGHSAEDWSTRPLPPAWLEYAALDVELLLELRDALAQRLAAAGKLAWAEQEFAALVSFRPAGDRADPWRRTSGLHRVRNRRGLAIVAELWVARDSIARARDIAPGRILPDSAIVEAALALPADESALMSVPGFRGRGSQRHRAAWGQALRRAWQVPEAGLPPNSARGTGPRDCEPPAQPRAWRQRDPKAADRLDRARAAITELSTQLAVPVENLVAPDLVRRMMWQPPHPLTESAAAELLAAGRARPWQVELIAPILSAAVSA